MQSLREQKKILDKKEHHLKEYLLKFEKFVKENQAKKLRAEKRAQTEKTIRQHKEKDIERLVDDSVVLQAKGSGKSPDLDTQLKILKPVCSSWNISVKKLFSSCYPDITE